MCDRVIKSCSSLVCESYRRWLGRLLRKITGAQERKVLQSRIAEMKKTFKDTIGQLMVIIDHLIRNTLASDSWRTYFSVISFMVEAVEKDYDSSAPSQFITIMALTKLPRISM